MKIGIVGYGHVGKAMHKLFTNACIHDKYLKIGSQKEINECYAAFICVPTPMNIDGSCNADIVEEVLRWCNCEIIIIRSTVYVGFTEKMANLYKKNIVFQPEYYGETIKHPFADLNERNWLSFGGSEKSIDLAIRVYQSVINANTKIFMAKSNEVEMAKYMENAFLATKVSFCNEFYDLCQKMTINYNQVREIWIADPRIGSSHTFVYEDKRGYSGNCLPKDVLSINSQMKIYKSDNTLINSVINKNKIYNI